MKIICITGFKKSGKTTLVEKLVRELNKYGTVGTIKHIADHGLEVFDDSEDTWRHFDAGSAAVIGVTNNGQALFTRDSGLLAGLDALSDLGIDFAVVEGFKKSGLAKIVIGDLVAENTVIRLNKVEDADIPELVDIIRKQPDYYTLKSLVRKIRTNPDIGSAGAIGTFTGIVRAKNGETETTALEFESYGEVAELKIKEICDNLKSRKGIVDVLIHHKTGRIKAGEDIVYIVVAAGHREELFTALKDAIEMVKAQVPIWKKEHTLNGEYWVHDAGI